MRTCPQCGYDHGHYSIATFKCIETGKVLHEAYWFCHSCAKLIYETDELFIEQVK